MKIKVVKMDDLTFGVAINGEVFKVNDGCTALGEAGSLMRSLNSKIMEAAAKARRARGLGTTSRDRLGVKQPERGPSGTARSRA